MQDSELTIKDPYEDVFDRASRLVAAVDNLFDVRNVQQEVFLRSDDAALLHSQRLFKTATVCKEMASWLLLDGNCYRTTPLDASDLCNVASNSISIDPRMWHTLLDPVSQDILYEISVLLDADLCGDDAVGDMNWMVNSFADELDQLRQLPSFDQKKMDLLVRILQQQHSLC